MAQLVIGMQICPAHSVAVGHPAEHRMRMPGKIAVRTGKSLNNGYQIYSVVLEISGRVSADELIDYRPCRSSFRPAEWNGERDRF